MSFRRGFSLIEMLVTLSVLTLLIMISVSWMTTMLRSQSITNNDANWKRASTAVLDRIADDIHTLDRLDVRSRSAGARIIADEKALRIQTRDQQGLTVHGYTFDHGSAAIYSSDQQTPMALDSIPLLGDVDSFECQIELPSDSRTLPTMTVVIRGIDGMSASRTFILGLEDVR
tara:strand:+ start:9951 stop:10469 length:519 start_codon:yes stop_codon:yes gene_type:complete